MSSYRLKNIIILILLFVNVSLLLLVGIQSYTRLKHQRELERQVLRLYEDSGITLLARDIAQSDDYPALSLQRDKEKELRLAESLLGSAPKVSDLGGGSTRYESELGEGRFRSSGYFEFTFRDLSITGSDTSLLDFCQRICREFSYDEPQALSQGRQSTVYTACALISGAPVYQSDIRFTFYQGKLQQVSGYLLPESGETSASHRSSAASALVQFLDYRNRNGIICNEVHSADFGYVLQPSSSAMRLQPVWKIATDSGEYYVNIAQRSISAQR